LGEVDEVMNLRPPSPLYNPRGASDEDFLSGFVARKELLELLLNGVRHVARGGASEHQLIVGQRGMGKSSLLRAIAVHVKNDDELRGAFAPLQFREEQYNVNALDVFWRNCGEALAQWCEDNALDALAGRLDRAIESEAWRDTETAANGFLEACAETGKRAILLLDNLELIVGGLKPDEPWALRRVLQMAGGPLVVGASTHFLRESGDREAAFYEFFHPHVLETLSESELTRCLRALADRAGQTGDAVKTILQQEPGRVRALYALTGGNPRVLAMTYQLLERRETAEVFADLEALLDKVSPYYKARVEEYATPQQRSVIDAIALNWDPILSHDLSAKAGIEITTVSTHLHRLKRDGFIEEVATSGTRAGYQIAERFLNIWYLMRHGTRRTRQRLAGLAAFFARLYSAPELEQMARLAVDVEASRRWHRHYREGLIEAARRYGVAAGAEEPSAVKAGAGSLDEILASARGWANKEAARLLAQALELELRGESRLALERWEEILSRYAASGDASLKALIALAMFCRVFALRKLGRGEEEIVTYDAIHARFGGDSEPAVRAVVALALFNKGTKLGALGRAEEAIAVYEVLDARFGGDRELTVREWVVKALANKGVRLGEVGRGEEETATYDVLDARFGGDSEPVVRAVVALTLFNKGTRLVALGRPEEAIAVYEALDARFGGDSEPAVRGEVAKALFDRGTRLGVLGRAEEAIAVYEALDARFGGGGELAVREWVVKALLNKGVHLGELGREEEETAAYDVLDARFGGDSEPAVRAIVALALFNKGARLGALGRVEEAIAVYEALDARFGGDSEPAVRAHVAKALFNRGFRLGALGRGDEAIAAYDVLHSRFGGDSETVVRALVAKALINKGLRLSALGRGQEAIAAYDVLHARFGGDSELAVREQVAKAQVFKGLELGNARRYDETIAVLDAFVARFDRDDEAALRMQVVWALLVKGAALGELRREEDAIAVFDALDARFGGDGAARAQIAKALFSKGVQLGALARREEAIAVYDSLDARFGRDSEQAIRVDLARALFNKGVMLGALGRREEEIAVYQALDTHFGRDSEPTICELVAKGLVRQGNVACDLDGRLDAAELAYRRAVSMDAHSETARVNLAWLLITVERANEASALRAELSSQPPSRLALLDAALDLTKDNFGSAMDSLGKALTLGFETSDADFFDELLRLLRLAEARGFGERLIGWFETGGFDIKYAPIHAAFVAYARGERFLRDVNPEVRRPAQDFYDKLSAPRRHAGGEPAGKLKRGRKRRG
jgi:tetratricopeptide (TPR) repeat protein